VPEDNRYSAPVGESYAGNGGNGASGLSALHSFSECTLIYTATITLNNRCCDVDVRKGRNKKQRKEERSDRMAGGGGNYESKNSERN